MSELVVYSTNGDYIETNDATYSIARAGSGEFINAYSPNSSLNVGQNIGFQCWEGFCDFDTSALGSGASISAAVLSLYVNTDNSLTDFTATAALRAWGADLAIADFVAGASLSALTTVATLASSGVTSNAYNDFTDVALPANIDKTGNTRLLIYSSRHSGNNTPTTDEHLGFYGSAHVVFKPRITITYTGGGGSGTTTQSHQMML